MRPMKRSRRERKRAMEVNGGDSFNVCFEDTYLSGFYTLL